MFTLIGLIDRYFIKAPRLRRFVTKQIEGDHDQKINLCGTSLLINSVKEHGYLRAARKCKRSSFLSDEVPVLVTLSLILSPGDTFVDIGANVGAFVMTLAKASNLAQGNVFYAFEANPDTFLRLKESICGCDIIAEQIALSNKNDFLEFVPGAVSHVFTTVDSANSYNILGHIVRVPCRRLDAMNIAGDSIILKIDVEGQEKQVLEGAEDLFKQGRIKAAYLDGYADRSVESFLRNYGFKFHDGRTLRPTSGNVFSLLAMRSTHV